jgi:hypothetical protein
MIYVSNMSFLTYLKLKHINECINFYYDLARRDNMKITTMIATATLFWVYVGLCLWVMGKLAGAI